MRLAGALCVLLSFPILLVEAQPAQTDPPPKGEVLHYYAEWRLIHAGEAALTLTPPTGPRRESEAILHVESVGLISKLYRIDDTYTVNLEDNFCAARSVLQAQEGGKEREVKVAYDGAARKASYVERDLKNQRAIHTGEVDIPACVHDVLGGLQALRRMNVEVGKSVELPTSDGKKFANVRVEAQERETLKIQSGVYKTVRYEAFLFNGVIYKRKARIFVWLTDDERKLPVQIRLQMQFTIGTVTLELEKEEHL